jgi:hypothetical protein
MKTVIIFWNKLYNKIKSTLKNTRVKYRKHNWILLEYNTYKDGYGPNVDVKFKCTKCNTNHYENRWAFVLGSGSLHSFFGKWWTEKDIKEDNKC